MDLFIKVTGIFLKSIVVIGILCIIWLSASLAMKDDPREFNPETNRMMIYKIRIIHCDGRDRIIIQERTEKNPPTANDIYASSGTGYLPKWENFFNVCDVEIIEAKLK